MGSLKLDFPRFFKDKYSNHKHQAPFKSLIKGLAWYSWPMVPRKAVQTSITNIDETIVMDFIMTGIVIVRKKSEDLKQRICFI